MVAQPLPVAADPPGRFPWRPRLGDVLGIVGGFALDRILLILVGDAGVGPPDPQLELARGRPPVGHPLFSGAEPAAARHVDAVGFVEYEEIARQGYWFDFDAKPNPYGTVACFPLYPMVVRAVGWLLGGRYVEAGLAVANLASIVGFVLLFQWANWRGGRRAAWLTVASAITFPAGLFWSALYPQSLFFALSIGSLALMLDRRVAGACLVAGLATATRLEAVAIIPALALIRVSQGGWRPVRADLWFLVTRWVCWDIWRISRPAGEIRFCSSKSTRSSAGGCGIRSRR